MVDLSTDLHEPETSELSTHLGGGTGTTEAIPAKEPEKQPRASRMDALKRAGEELEAKAPTKAEEAKPVEAEPKAEPAAKDAAPEGDKLDEVEKGPEPAAKPQADKPRRQPIEAPEKFLPRAKELWANTPHEVRADMQRVISEAEAERTQATESAKEYESLKPFAEMAKRSGTTLDQAMGRYVQMEQTLRSDPVAGFRSLMQNMNITPVQAIGHIMAATNVRPEQLAQHLVNAPNEYTALAQPQQQAQQPQRNSEVEQLRQQVAQLQSGVQHSQIMATVIDPFARENPRYHELEGTIAQFLQSDIVPKTLSVHDRLAAAYDMAVRISPATKSAPEPQVQLGQEADSRAGKDFGGTKSVRGAPASGVETINRSKGKLSRGDALRQAMADLDIAH